MTQGGKQKRLRALNRQVARLERRLKRLEAVSWRYSWSRLGIVLAGVFAAFLVNYLLGGGPGWIAAGIFAAAFLVVVRRHDRVEKSLLRHRIWLRIKSTHIARMGLNWERIPLPPVAPPERDHPFDADLNLTGERSLHQLLDTASSRGGSERLRNWLLMPTPDPAHIRTRQALVRELLPLSVFRDRLTLNGALVSEDVDARWDGEAIRRWLEGHTSKTSLKPYVVLLGVLAAANILLAILYALSVTPALWMVSFAVYAAFYMGLYVFKFRDLSALFEDAHHLQKTLTPFGSVLLYLETYAFPGSRHLAGLCEPFRRAECRPSEHLKRIARIAGAASWQRGQLLGIMLNALMPWDLYFSHRLARCKEEVGAHLPVWLNAWYELEALNALANFAYLNPDTVFPELVIDAPGDRPVFCAGDLGHPLIPDDDRVCNDFTVETPGAIAIVTGSNMSGKSTFLRTLGVNLRLAYAGGTVVASTLRTVPFRMFTCIGASDSLADGISYFCAEVKRLKALLRALEADHPLPLFFLIDEIFRGTNNRERLIGSRAYIRALAGSRGTGVISTHDLELVHLAEKVPGVRNYHFREEVRAGRMAFDFRLRPGPCPTTNALKIMRMEGLPVDIVDD